MSLPVKIENQLAAIQQRLSDTKLQHYELAPEFGIDSLLDSAVLLPLLAGETGLEVLFTQRTEHVSKHKGQISFPGGQVEAADRSLADTALRETLEETGIQPQDVRLLGPMSSWPVPTGFRIYPYVGFVSQYEPALSVSEVHTVFHVPLQHLADYSNMEIKEWFSFGVHHPLPFFYWQEREIWGATALILKEFIDNTRDLY